MSGSNKKFLVAKNNVKDLQCLLNQILSEKNSNSYTDEQSQDAVGNILSNSATISFLYNDTTPSISASVIDKSITYSKIQDIPTSVFLGRISAGTGSIEELSVTQATSLLNNFTSLLKGLVPASGGGTTNFLRADGTWAAPPAGGTPGGSNTQVQFNNAGSFGGSANLVFDGTILTAVNTIVGSITGNSGTVTNGVYTTDSGTIFLSPSAISSTYAPKVSPTFATSITGSYLTALQLLGTDVSKNIVSLSTSTYPSLTELSYVKGVTSSIQTQLGTKGDLFGPASATDNSITRFDSTTGKLVQNSTSSLDDDGTITARSGIGGQNGSIILRTGANPILEIRGDIANGYYPALTFYATSLGLQGTIGVNNGIAISPASGYSAGAISAYQTTTGWSVRSTYIAGIHTVPMFKITGYQGAANNYELWQDGSVKQYGAKDSVNYPLGVPVAISAVASGSGSSLSAGTYYYKITASNIKNETIGSSELSVTITAGQNVVITWANNAVNTNGVDHFRVYRATSPGGYTATSRIDPSPVGVPYYSHTLTDTGQTATSGTPPTSLAHSTITYRRWQGQVGSFIKMQDENGNLINDFNVDGSIVFNEQGLNADLRIEGDTNPNLLFCDASADNIGIGINTPTARLHLMAGSVAANTAPLKLTAGTNLTIPEDGAIEFDGTNIYITVGGVRKTFTIV